LSTVLQATERRDLKHSTTNKLRKEGSFPAVVYGRKVQSKPISVNSADFIKAIREAGRNGILTLTVNDEKYSVMLHDIQTDPLKSEVLHADFQVVDMSTEVEVDVNVVLTGDAPGVKEGGVMQQAENMKLTMNLLKRLLRFSLLNKRKTLIAGNSRMQ
jgi:large subunit ribosomal protein L25